MVKQTSKPVGIWEGFFIIYFFIYSYCTAKSPTTLSKTSKKVLISINTISTTLRTTERSPLIFRIWLPLRSLMFQILSHQPQFRQLGTQVGENYYEYVLDYTREFNALRYKTFLYYYCFVHTTKKRVTTAKMVTTMPIASTDRTPCPISLEIALDSFRLFVIGLVVKSSTEQ